MGRGRQRGRRVGAPVLCGSCNLHYRLWYPPEVQSETRLYEGSLRCGTAAVGVWTGWGTPPSLRSLPLDQRVSARDIPSCAQHSLPLTPAALANPPYLRAKLQYRSRSRAISAGGWTPKVQWGRAAVTRGGKKRPSACPGSLRRASVRLGTVLEEYARYALREGGGGRRHICSVEGRVAGM